MPDNAATWHDLLQRRNDRLNKLNHWHAPARQPAHAWQNYGRMRSHTTNKPKPPASSSEDISGLTDHLFRHESGRLVSILTGILGINRLQLAEDVVQEALLRALKTWPYYGVPDNPSAWLLQTARNLAFDTLRRDKRFVEKQPDIDATLHHRSTSPDSQDEPLLPEEIRDHQLRLIFACCHPDIPAADQTALALRTLCGLSAAEIASAFLTSESAVQKRLTRARQRIRDQQIPFEIPAGAALEERLKNVLQVLYLLFNEGYKASTGDDLVRTDLCSEAVRLASLLAEHPVTNTPGSNALLALMLLHCSRISTRTDTRGNVLRLQDQDRSLWNQKLIRRGLEHLTIAATGSAVSDYHLQAAIAACHATAESYEKTDWQRILYLYDQWLMFSYSPVVALNRAVALGHVEGPAAAIEAVQKISSQNQMETYYLTHAVLGEFEAQQQNLISAVKHLERAIALTSLKSEQKFLAKKLRLCKEGIPE